MDKKLFASFSDELRRLATTRGSIMELAGAWKDLSEKEAERMKERIRERRNEQNRLNEIHRKR